MFAGLLAAWMRGACFTCVITVGVISCGQAKETSTPPRVVYSDPSTDGIGRVQQSGGMLFLVHGDRLTSIDLRSRVVRWTHYPTSDFTTSGGSVYVLSRSASNGDAILMDLDATSGRVSWSRPSEDGRLLADDYGPIVGNGRAIVQYDRRGKVRWSASSVENFKTIVAIPDHLLFVSGVASGAVIHPLASFIDSSTGKLVATNFLGDAIEVRPSAILAQAYGQANFDTWCGYADISKVDLFRDGKPSISSSRYLFEPIADNVQSSPCVDDRDNYPKAFASDDDLALVSGPVVAIFSINEPAHPNTVLKGERYLQGPSNETYFCRTALI